MKPYNVRNFVHAALISTLGSALLSVSAPSNAASKTLTISGKPATTARVEGDYSFLPVAKDTVKSRIKFNIYNKPAWAQFDETTGKLSGRPSGRDVGTYRDITIRLTDWYGYVTTPVFSITVVNAPSAKTAPVAESTPVPQPAPVVKPVPVVTPAPVVEPVPVVPPAPVAKPVPVVTPTPVATPAPVMSAGNALLDWIPPTENSDGTVLTDLAGYNVHYGPSPNQMTQLIKVANPGLASYMVENLSSGTWYFAVTSYATDGMESARSGVVSTTIP